MPLSPLSLARRLPHEKVAHDMGILEGKKLLVTGVLMDSSIAFHVAKIAQEGRGGRADLLRADHEDHPDHRQAAAHDALIELDVADQEHLDTLADRLRQHVDRLDGVLHSIGFAPQGAFNFLEGSGKTCPRRCRFSAYSLNRSRWLRFRSWRTAAASSA